MSDGAFMLIAIGALIAILAADTAWQTYRDRRRDERRNRWNTRNPH